MSTRDERLASMPLRLHRRVAMIVLVVIIAVVNASTASPTAQGVSLRGKVNIGAFAKHNELLGTDPPYGAKLDAGPARVTLTFDLPAQRGFSTIVVTGPDRKQWQAGPATEDGTTVVAPLRPLGPAGEYTVAWRIVSADGHPVQGTFPFTLTKPGPGTAPAPPASAGGSGSATGGTGGRFLWLWLTGAGALVAAGVVMAQRLRRTRSGGGVIRRG